MLNESYSLNKNNYKFLKKLSKKFNQNRNLVDKKILFYSIA